MTNDEIQFETDLTVHLFESRAEAEWRSSQPATPMPEVRERLAAMRAELHRRYAQGIQHHRERHGVTVDTTGESDAA